MIPLAIGSVKEDAEHRKTRFPNSTKRTVNKIIHDIVFLNGKKLFFLSSNTTGIIIIIMT